MHFTVNTGILLFWGATDSGRWQHATARPNPGRQQASLHNKKTRLGRHRNLTPSSSGVAPRNSLARECAIVKLPLDSTHAHQLACARACRRTRTQACATQASNTSMQAHRHASTPTCKHATHACRHAHMRAHKASSAHLTLPWVSSSLSARSSTSRCSPCSSVEVMVCGRVGVVRRGG